MRFVGAVKSDRRLQRRRKVVKCDPEQVFHRISVLLAAWRVLQGRQDVLLEGCMHSGKPAAVRGLPVG